MSNIKKIESLDDKTLIEFDLNYHEEGYEKSVYFNPDRKYVIYFYKKMDENKKKKLTDIVTEYRPLIFCDTSFENNIKQLFRWPEHIVKFDERFGIVVPFYEKNFYFSEPFQNKAIEKNGFWFSTGKNLNKFVPSADKGSLLGFIIVCLNMTRALKRMHNARIIHSTLSYNSTLIDPQKGESYILDVENLVFPNTYPLTEVEPIDCLAPELISEIINSKDNFSNIYPKISSDLHSLAVLIYLYLFHRHPLYGSKICDIDKKENLFQQFSKNPVFIEHPSDISNRINILDVESCYLPWLNTDKLPYTIMGKYLEKLFDRAFIDGLTNPEKRPTAKEWEKALIQTLDLMVPCSNPNCSQKWFVFYKMPLKCPYCETSISGKIPILSYENDKRNRLIVFNNLFLHNWHTKKDYYPSEITPQSEREKVGCFRFFDNQWYFTNINLHNLSILIKIIKKYTPF
jgi:serine/threonine protein kinase